MERLRARMGTPVRPVFACETARQREFALRKLRNWLSTLRYFSQASKPAEQNVMLKPLKRYIKEWLFRLCHCLNALSLFIQHRILHVTLEQKRSADTTDIPVTQMDRDLLAMYIRWMGHTVEKTVRYKKSVGRGHGRPAQLRAALDEWSRRGYPGRKFIHWAEENLEDHRRWELTGMPQMHPENELSPIDETSSVIHVLTNRVSTRYWKPILIDRTAIDRIVSIGCYAPTSCNRQTWKLYIKRRTDFAGVDDMVGVGNKMLVERAPVVVWIAIDERLYPEVWAAAEDAGIMGLQLNLAASALGLAGCLMYGGDNFPQAEWRKEVGAPEHHYMYLTFMFGHPAERTLTDKRAYGTDISVYVDEND